jgi:hypothetical protein
MRKRNAIVASLIRLPKNNPLFDEAIKKYKTHAGGLKIREDI